MCEHHRGAQVHVERAVDFIHGERIDRAGRRERGVGDQDVDVACLLGEAFDLGRHGQIDGHRLGAELRRELLERVAASAGHGQTPTTIDHCLRDRVPDSAGGARQQNG